MVKLRNDEIQVIRKLKPNWEIVNTQKNTVFFTTSGRGRRTRVLNNTVSGVLTPYRLKKAGERNNNTGKANWRNMAKNIGGGLYSFGRVRPTSGLPRGVYPELRFLNNKNKSLGLGQWVVQNKATASELKTDPTSGEVHDSSIFGLDTEDDENQGLIIEFAELLVPSNQQSNLRNLKEEFAKTWRQVARAQAANGSYLELHSMGFKNRSSDVLYLDRSEITGPGSIAFRQIVGQGTKTNLPQNRIFLKTRITLQHVNSPDHFVRQFRAPNTVDALIAELQNHAKGKWAGEPDVVQWIMTPEGPEVRIYELKIGSGKNETNEKGAHEYNQLIRVKRAFDNYLDFVEAKLKAIRSKTTRTASETATLNAWSGWRRPVVKTYFTAFLKGSSPKPGRKIMFGRNNGLERQLSETPEMRKESHWRQVRELNGKEFCDLTKISYDMISSFIDQLNHQRVEQFKMVLDRLFKGNTNLGRAYSRMVGTRYNRIRSLIANHPEWLDPVNTKIGNKRANGLNIASNNNATRTTAYAPNARYKGNNTQNAGVNSSLQPLLQSITTKSSLFRQKLLQAGRRNKVNKLNAVLSALGPKGNTPKNEVRNLLKGQSNFLAGLYTRRAAPSGNINYLNRVNSAIKSGQNWRTVPLLPQEAEAIAAYRAGQQAAEANIARAQGNTGMGGLFSQQ